MDDILEKTDQETRKLYKHKGCWNCSKICLFNAPVATKEIAELSNRIFFKCNSYYPFY